MDTGGRPRVFPAESRLNYNRRISKSHRFDSDGHAIAVTLTIPPRSRKLFFSERSRLFRYRRADNFSVVELEQWSGVSSSWNNWQIIASLREHSQIREYIIVLLFFLNLFILILILISIYTRGDTTLHRNKISTASKVSRVFLLKSRCLIIDSVGGLFTRGRVAVIVLARYTPPRSLSFGEKVHTFIKHRMQIILSNALREGCFSNPYRAFPPL